MSKSAPSNRESIDPQAFYDEVARLNLSPLWLREGHPPHKRAVPWLLQWPHCGPKARPGFVGPRRR